MTVKQGPKKMVQSKSIVLKLDARKAGRANEYFVAAGAGGQTVKERQIQFANPRVR